MVAEARADRDIARRFDLLAGIAAAIARTRCNRVRSQQAPRRPANVLLLGETRISWSNRLAVDDPCCALHTHTTKTHV